MTGAPGELQARGKAIWDAYSAGKLNAADRALVHELARCADTLDKLDALAQGRREAWASLVFDDMGEVHLSVDKLLDERRTHQLAFKSLIAEVRQAGIKPQSNQAKDEEPEDMLTKRRRDKAERERKLG